MSSESGISSGSSYVGRGSCVGIPKNCLLCGRKVQLLISRSTANPNRKFFRCEYAAANKLSGDNHLFKWLSEAVPEEVLKMSQMFEIFEKNVAENEAKFEILAKNVAESEARTLEVQKMVVEKMEDESKKVRIACALTFVGCLIVTIISKLF